MFRVLRLPDGALLKSSENLAGDNIAVAKAAKS